MTQRATRSRNDAKMAAGLGYQTEQHGYLYFNGNRDIPLVAANMHKNTPNLNYNIRKKLPLKSKKTVLNAYAALVSCKRKEPLK